MFDETPRFLLDETSDAQEDAQVALENEEAAERADAAPHAEEKPNG